MSIKWDLVYRILEKSEMPSLQIACFVQTVESQQYFVYNDIKQTKEKKKQRIIGFCAGYLT